MQRNRASMAIARRTIEALVAALAALGPLTVSAEIIRVGPGMQYASAREAAAIAEDGDTVEIAAGEYVGDVAAWSQSDLTIRGVGGIAHFRANGEAAERKGIWVIKGNNVIVENIEFSGARVADKNGAGIRHEGGNLTVRSCRFHENENGILAGNGPATIRIENSEFWKNGHGDGRSHNIYINMIDRLEVTASHFHQAVVGHNIKSRARETIITYSRIEDGTSGNASYLVDTPNGGRVVLIGNILQQGPYAENGTLLAYNLEAEGRAQGELFIINNTFVNDRHAGQFMKIANPLAHVHVQNTIFLGRGELADRDIRQVSNLVVEDERSWLGAGKVFRDRNAGDYRLAEEAKAVDAGTALEEFGMEELRPVSEYRDTARSVERNTVGAIDIGALERGLD